MTRCASNSRYTLYNERVRLTEKSAAWRADFVADLPGSPGCLPRPIASGPDAISDLGPLSSDFRGEGSRRRQIAGARRVQTKIVIVRPHLAATDLRELADDIAERLYAKKTNAANIGGRPRTGEQKPVADPRQVRQRKSAEKAAATTGASGRLVSAAKRIERHAPDLAEKVKSGDTAIDRAERIIRDREAEQQRIAQARAQAAAEPTPATVDIRHGDFRTVLADLTGIDAIITDPPYPAEFLPLLSDLGAWADKVAESAEQLEAVARLRRRTTP